MDARPLIVTKLQAPVERRLVERRRLLDQLASEPYKLTLVQAPAGWGKSSLLAEWSRLPAEGRAFAWLALEPSEDEPVQFWHYVIEALRGVDDAIGAASMQLLHAPGTDVSDDVLPTLVNELAGISRGSVLVLEDYHRIRSPQIHAQLGTFLEYLPSTLQLSLATRSEPPLPLARLRVNRELLEIGVDQLRFDEGETGALLNEVLGLGLEPSALRRLRQRTEGWAAGLYLAALSLQAADDSDAFVERFSGDDRHLVDYLGSEVLASQPEPVREFLVRTSILDRFTAPLCAAVAGEADAQQLLTEIERANLFLVPLDSRRTWYRYHHLFQELLRLELSLAAPAEIDELHRRAARWFLDNGLVSEAIEHTIAAGDVAEAGELIAGNWALTLLGSAGDRTVERWLAALPDATRCADLRLCFAQAFIDLSLGRMDAVQADLVTAEEAPVVGPFLEGLTSREGALACIRAAYLWESGDAAGSFAAAQAVLDAEPEGAPWRAIGVACLGLGHMARGDWPEGMHWVGEYARIGRESGHHLNHASGLASVAACLAELEEWDRAEAAARESLAIADAYGIGEHWCMAHAHLAVGLAREHGGEAEAAGSALERAAELVRRGYGPTPTAWIGSHLARVLAELGDRDGAQEALSEAKEAVETAADVGIFAERLRESERLLGLRARPPAAEGERLSERELEVLRLLPTRLSQREIGAELYVSLNTVKTHTKNIFRKLGATGREDAVAKARERGIVGH